MMVKSWASSKVVLSVISISTTHLALGWRARVRLRKRISGAEGDGKRSDLEVICAGAAGEVRLGFVARGIPGGL
jgi:hypothetical protein